MEGAMCLVVFSLVWIVVSKDFKWQIAFQYLRRVFLFFKGLCVCVCARAGAQGVQERMSDPLELELQEFVIYLTWVLGFEL